MALIKQIWAGEKVQCPICKKGIFLPRFPNIPIKENKQFICSECGEKLTVVLKMPRED